MADDLKERGPADAARVNVNEDHEVRYWCRKFRVDPERLRNIVAKVGPMATDVEKEVGASKA